jgi:hypothetical protein
MYYKVSKSNLSFNEAIEAFKNKNVIRNGAYGIKYDPSEVKIEDLKFSVNEIQSNNWNILVRDNEMNEKLEEIRDIMREMNLNIDSRFFFISRMNIDDYWTLFESQFLTGKDNLLYDVMKWFYYNRYNKAENT